MLVPGVTQTYIHTVVWHIFCFSSVPETPICLPCLSIVCCSAGLSFEQSKFGALVCVAVDPTHCFLLGNHFLFQNTSQMYILCEIACYFHTPSCLLPLLCCHKILGIVLLCSHKAASFTNIRTTDFGVKMMLEVVIYRYIYIF